MSKESNVWYTIKMTQSYLSFSASTIRRAIASGQLRHRRVNGNGKILFHRSWIDSWILGFNSHRLTKPQKQTLKDLS